MKIMEPNITFRGIRDTKRIREYLIKRLRSLERYMIEPIGIHIVVRKNSNGYVVEGNILCKDFDAYAKEENKKDVFTAIDYFKDSIKKQLKKKREKIVDKKTPSRMEVPPLGTEVKISQRELVVTERIEIKPMYCEEAILQMKLNKLPFFVFKDASTGRISVLYEKDKERKIMGLIVPEE